jgi:threonine dehydrogenase-like Zn-dependent dehydrogenase
MKTTALRLYGKSDLRLETFELPPTGEDEILAEVLSNSVCMSDHKAALQGADHKRVPKDIDRNPTIIGHEFAGCIREVGRRWAGRFRPGQKFSIQPALGYQGSLDAPGYSFRYIGGNASFVLIPSCVMEMDCLLAYDGDAFFKASLSEPMSCIVGAAHAQYHTRLGSYEHAMGIVEGGRCALLAGAGPMGLGCVDYLVHGPRKPALLVVTDIDAARLERAAHLMTVDDGRKHGVALQYLNTGRTPDPVAALREAAAGNAYDDVFVFAPVAAVIEQADAVLARDGCLNFFAGPTRPEFSARFNFYNVHYAGTHLVGTSGGNTDDMREALKLMSEGRINPAAMISHVGGITSAADTILRLPDMPGGKKLTYTQVDLPMTAIGDFAEVGRTHPLFAALAELCARHHGLWNVEAETHLLAHAPRVAMRCHRSVMRGGAAALPRPARLRFASPRHAGAGSGAAPSLPLHD